MVDTYTYLLGPVRLQRYMHETTTTKCNKPDAFKDSLPKLCVKRTKDWADTILVPSRNRTAAVDLLMGLQNDGWLDESAGVRMDFNAYNTEMSMVYVNRVRVDFTKSGKVKPRQQ